MRMSGNMATQDGILLDVVRAFYALRPEGIAWPIDAQGLPSFKLEALC